MEEVPASSTGKRSRPEKPQAAPTPPKTLAEVFRLHAGFVWRTAHRLGAPEEAIDDIVQEVFLVLHRRLEQYDASRGELMTWLHVITRGIVSNHRRSMERAERRLRLVPEPPGGPGPDQDIEARKAAAAMSSFLARLDPKKRAIFELIDVEGMPAPQVAKALGVRLNTVYSRLRTARKAFASFAAGYRAGKAEHDDA